MVRIGFLAVVAPNSLFFCKRWPHEKENPWNESWRSILKSCLKRIGSIKEESTIEMLGYSSLELKEHLEKLFVEGMTWENRVEWHIDHIKPISSFDKDP